MSVSILLGSGFSVAAGLPLVSKINEVLTTLKIDEFTIGLDGNAFFLNGQTDLNESFRRSERTFFVEFILYYVTNIDALFNYEKFFDFYTAARKDRNPQVEEFISEFNEKHKVDKRYSQHLSDFNDTFNQLLASILQRKELQINNTHLLNYPKYGNFINFMSKLEERNGIINIHSLNHDLLVEHIGHNTQLYSKFCDGYTTLESPYYGNLTANNHKYVVRLQHFTNVFNRPIRLYKLHGSVDAFEFNIGSPDTDTTRVKWEYGVSDLRKEANNYDEQLDYINGWQRPYPDFLSGTTEKILHYGAHYYKEVFESFVENLRSCRALVIIGYGFGDEKINELIDEHVLSRELLPIVVDPYESTQKFYEENTFKFYKNYAIDPVYDQILRDIPSD